MLSKIKNWFIVKKLGELTFLDLFGWWAIIHLTEGIVKGATGRNFSEMGFQLGRLITGKNRI